LAGGAGGAADFAEAGTQQRVGRQTHVDDVEEVEEFSAKLQIETLNATRAAAKGRALDEGKIVVVISRPAEGVTSQSAEEPVVGASPPGTLMGIEKYEALFAPRPK
jgi:hypothetical protein